MEFGIFIRSHYAFWMWCLCTIWYNRLPPSCLSILSCLQSWMWYDSVPIEHQILWTIVYDRRCGVDDYVQFCASLELDYNKFPSHTDIDIDIIKSSQTSSHKYHRMHWSVLQRNKIKTRTSWIKRETNINILSAESYIMNRNIIYYVQNNDTLLFYASIYFQPQLNIWWPLGFISLFPSLGHIIKLSSKHEKGSAHYNSNSDRYIDACSFVFY